MAKINQNKGLETYTIFAEDGVTQATFVPERGGAASSMIMPGQSGPRELLFQHDHFWDTSVDELPGAWPFCFPVCARLERDRKSGAYSYQHTIYELPIHGFAWRLPWLVVDHGDDHILLELRDSVNTQAVYPFQFIVQLHYHIRAGELTCRQTYSNRGDHAMPYYAGFHPYFLTPPAGQGKERVTLFYSPVKRLQYNERLTDVIGEQALFPLPVNVADPGINEQLTVLGENRTINLRFPDGDTLFMEAGGIEDENLFPYVQLYTMADKPFICVEPWMGAPNAMNSVQGVRWLAPKQNEHGILRLWIERESY